MGLFSRTRRVDHRELVALRDELAEVRERLQASDAATTALQARSADAEVIAAALAELRQAQAHTADEIAAIHQRISNVTAELANQLTELSQDIDSMLTARTGDFAGSGDSRTVEHLQDAQVRLASEQARYQIAFRQDLAALAELVTRARSGG